MIDTSNGAGISLGPQVHERRDSGRGKPKPTGEERPKPNRSNIALFHRILRQ